ncbi:MAG: PRC-barrel domain containing protein [Gemmatimonadales bacterium]
MPAREIRLEEILGRVVRTAAGRPVGRIEDVRVVPDGEDYVVQDVILGELGLRAQMFSIAGQLPTLKSIGLAGRYRTRAIPWDWLDFSDPLRPRFREGQTQEGSEEPRG